MEENLDNDLRELVATAHAALDALSDFRPIRKFSIDQVNQDLQTVRRELEEWSPTGQGAELITRTVDRLCSILFCVGIHDARWKKMLGLLGIMALEDPSNFCLQYRIIGGVDPAVEPMAIPFHEIWACRAETKCLFALYYDYPDPLDIDTRQDALTTNFIHAARAIFEGDLRRAVAPMKAVVRYWQLEDEEWLYYHAGFWPLFDPDATALAKFYVQRGGDPMAFTRRERLYLAAALG